MEDDNYPDACSKILACVQRPVVGEAGKTGTWRTLRPVIDLDACIQKKKREKKLPYMLDVLSRRCHFSRNSAKNQL